MTVLISFRESAKKGLQVLSSIGKFCIFSHCVLEYVGDIVICSGPSMEPSLHSNDVLITEHISPRFGWLNRGDIIVTRSPNNPSQYVCKRIVGMAGDELLKSDGVIEHIPRGHIWIEGDNEHNSKDSRSYGPLPLGLVRGRALFRIWPPFCMKYFVKDNGSKSLN